MQLRFRRRIRRAERIMKLTSEHADRLIAGARAKAKTIGIAVSVAILDSAGHMKAFSRMDGAWLGSADVALRKARTSILFEAETQSIWDICKPGAQGRTASNRQMADLSPSRAEFH
jgi:uncharacterized protein GlcG (DUF336 family)